MINPAFVPLSNEFGITPVQASYELTVYIVSAGVGPLLTVPLANVYGRRPVYILGSLMAAVTNIAAGKCTSWPGLMVTRVFNGIGAGSPVAIGAATICDIYYLHERGFYMGIFSFFLVNGPHVASLLGGFIAQNLGWRWSFLIPVSQFAEDIEGKILIVIIGIHSNRHRGSHTTLPARNHLLASIRARPP